MGKRTQVVTMSDREKEVLGNLVAREAEAKRVFDFATKQYSDAVAKAGAAPDIYASLHAREVVGDGERITGARVDSEKGTIEYDIETPNKVVKGDFTPEDAGNQPADAEGKSAGNP